MHAILAILVAAAAPEVFTRTPQAQLDGEALVFSFELGARSGPALVVKSIDYTVTVQGVVLFSGTAQGFDVPAGSERAIALAGFGERERTLSVLGKLASVQSFDYRVHGVLHLAGGDVPFSVTGRGETPDEIAFPKKPKQPANSLLAY